MYCWLGGVQVWLVAVEVMEVVLLRLLLIRPVSLLLARENDGRLHIWRLIRPYVVVAVRRLSILACGFEPGMTIGSVVNDQVSDHFDAVRLGGFHELGEVAQISQPAVNTIVVRYVVPIVTMYRRIEGHQPDAGDTEAGQVIDALRQSFKISDSVAVAVQE